MIAWGWESFQRWNIQKTLFCFSAWFCRHTFPTCPGNINEKCYVYRHVYTGSSHTTLDSCRRVKLVYCALRRICSTHLCTLLEEITLLEFGNLSLTIFTTNCGSFNNLYMSQRNLLIYLCAMKNLHIVKPQHLKKFYEQDWYWSRHWSS